MKVLSIAAALVATIITAAHSEEDDEERQFSINQFKGWTGLLLSCEKNTADPALVQAICDVAKTEFTYLAENSKIPYRISVGDDMFRRSMIAHEIGKPLTLTIKTIPTSGNSYAKAVYVEVSAENFYSNVIDKEAAPSDPESLPRAGDLSLWSGNMIASGTDTQVIVRDMTPYIGQQMKAFFTDFLKGWNAK
ncbi:MULTISPECIES: hypothetical protein [Sinorhizobium]|uniref:hypothetical protein n=1 Tax=Sinorhizobium TaxID=28105 RepID=UPI000BE9FDCF|nr:MULTISPECIES: hypothetical protein [Sinorhizobium]PDT50937.1 hypothetical protein CO664_24635 [Sinorhizobium sp. NG07B]POH25053.1 hypothetical protein ATY30_28870 [Sinorhizobium americanum]